MEMKPCPVCKNLDNVTIREISNTASGWLIGCFYQGEDDNHSIVVQCRTKEEALQKWNSIPRGCRFKIIPLKPPSI